MPGAIILAAGSSRRFGDDKRRARLPNGKLVIQQTVELVLACFEDVLLVLGPDDEDFEKELVSLIRSPRLKTFLAPDAALGMGHSLANAVSQAGEWDGMFVFLADMPFIQAATINLLKSHHDEGIVVPVLNGVRGHPVGFPARLFPELKLLEGDRGARKVMEDHGEDIVEIFVEDAGVVKDVDTPEDLEP